MIKPEEETEQGGTRVSYRNNRTRRRQRNRSASVRGCFSFTVSELKEIAEEFSILVTRSERRNGTPGPFPRPASIGSMASADIGGDMFWNTPLSSVTSSSISMSVFRRRFLPTCLPKKGYKCRVTSVYRVPLATGRNFDQKKPDTSMDLCFSIFIQINVVSDQRVPFNLPVNLRWSFVDQFPRWRQPGASK